MRAVEQKHAIMETYGGLEYLRSSNTWTLWYSIGIGYYLSYMSIPAMYDHVEQKMWYETIAVEAASEASRARRG